MYDTEKRIELVKKRECMNTTAARSGAQSAVCPFCVPCCSCPSWGAMGIMQSRPINATGMYGTILLHEGAGGYVLVAVISFTVAVVITALCIKFRKRGQKSQDAEDHV